MNTKKKKIFGGALAIFLLAPGIAFAQSLVDFLGVLQEAVNALIPILTTAAIAAFFWGLAKYIFNAADEKAKEEGKAIMIWGTIAVFVLLSIYGIVGFIQQTTTVDQASTEAFTIDLPDVTM